MKTRAQITGIWWLSMYVCVYIAVRENRMNGANRQRATYMTANGCVCVQAATKQSNNTTRERTRKRHTKKESQVM